MNIGIRNSLWRLHYTRILFHRSYCSHHREYQKGFGSGEELECPICMEELIANPNQAIWAPCCKRKTWFHKLCLQVSGCKGLSK